MSLAEGWTEAFRAGLAACEGRPVRPSVWPRVEARLGFALPSDYKLFLERVGSGSFEGEVAVLPPEPPPEHPQWRSLLDNIGRHLSGTDPAPWSRWCFFLADGNGNEAGWLREGPDPDAWPVDLFVHEDEERPVRWAESFRDLVERMGSVAGIRHPGFEEDDQFLLGRPKAYA